MQTDLQGERVARLSEGIAYASQFNCNVVEIALADALAFRSALLTDEETEEREPVKTPKVEEIIARALEECPSDWVEVDAHATAILAALKAEGFVVVKEKK